MTTALPTRLPKLSHRLEHEGAVLRVILDQPPGNVLDSEMTASLRTLLRESEARPDLKLVVLEGAGQHFSFGASVEEHRPEHVRAMFEAFHGLFRDLARAKVPLLALVRGQCLGGGLELAAFCDWIFAAESARLGQPEIKLGVFAPVGSILLPWRCGGRAIDLLLTGRSIDPVTARSWGLVDSILPDTETEGRLEEWIREHVLPLSASSLRRARLAARGPLHARLLADLPGLEALYLDDLMRTQDAVEGITAFLAKRPPVWVNR